jgi:hypothetical protein
MLEKGLQNCHVHAHRHRRSKEQRKKDGYIAGCIKKNEAEHIVDNLVTERVRLTLGKMRKIRRILTL